MLVPNAFSLINYIGED
uniref:Uncharacterized protein n=1 Tax=Rhizophora mucronata TaxID=61149 RepID=A0A2P2PHK5_RHIMU